MDRKQAQDVAEKFMTPRYRRLDRLERYVDGTVYDGREDFFAPSRDVPLLERRPAFVYPIVANAIRSNGDLILGEERWPRVEPKVLEEGDTSEFGTALEEDDAETVAYLIQRIIEQAKLKLAMRRMLESAQTCGTAVLVATVRLGKLCVEQPLAKWCTPEFDAYGRLESLEIRYPYVVDFFNPEIQKFECRAMLYRRTIDAQSDTVYLPAIAPIDGREPAWTVDAERSVAHGLGFVPAIWYAFGGACVTADSDDGTAIHANLTDEIDLLNVGLSQRALAAHYAGDPQIWETGVSEFDGPQATGRATIAPAPGTPADAERYLGAHFSGGGARRPARKKGAGAVWRYEQSESKVGMLTLPGDALKAVDEHLKDIRSKIEESLGVVFVDPTTARTVMEISGKAQEMLFKRQVDRCSYIREDFGDNALIPTLSMLIRLAYSVEKKAPGSLYLEGLKAASVVVSRFEQLTANGITMWMGCELDCTWGPFFAPDDADKLAMVQMVTTARDGNLITDKTAIKTTASLFPIGNLDAEIEELEKAREEQKLALQAAMDAGAHDHGDTGKPEGAPPSGDAKPGGRGGRKPKPSA